MYAVIETGGKQYRVEVGTVLEIEKLEVEAGASITIDRVLLVADGDEAAIGRPVVGDATVRAEVLRQARGEKVINFKYKPKARRRVKKGHRQDLTILRVSDITFHGRSAAESVRASEEAAKTERERLEEAAARQAAADAALAAKLAARKPKEPAAPAPEPAEEAGPAPRGRRRKAVAAEPAKTEEPGKAAESTESPEPVGSAEPTEAPARPKRRTTKKDG